MLNLNPETVQLLAALVILPPLAYLAHWLRRYRQRPRITDRGYYAVGRDEFRAERKAVLHELQRGRFTQPVEHPRVVSLSSRAPKGFQRWPKDAANSPR